MKGIWSSADSLYRLQRQRWLKPRLEDAETNQLAQAFEQALHRAGPIDSACSVVAEREGSVAIPHKARALVHAFSKPTMSVSTTDAKFVLVKATSLQCTLLTGTLAGLHIMVSLSRGQGECHLFPANLRQYTLLNAISGGLKRQLASLSNRFSLKVQHVADI